ncbi:hypothetical protein [Corynebacterium liangguodongii]|uniref:Uncharacterized protein n=1 Tax=Corynebacterium liangguodongii TaxID=2079535 RepID=A0A2S0WCR7_9CORY|nr:hypothetical protein [Corynebacterium liangguodongii]AWB83561.1 hypothetical protein C3E79_02865 [Corynebacterium liangguodongii]PWC00350.1 hypothetical protein DF219_00090 [Corynebacterium liangguodongii]
MDIPRHVLSAFQVDGINPVAAGPAWDNGVRYARVVIAPATATSAWSAKVRERFSSPALSVARPVRATDGRVVVGGFRANDFVEGELAARADESIAAALAFDDAVAGVEPPAGRREDRWAKADRAAFENEQFDGPVGLAHLDFFSCCIFSGSLPPTLTDIVPSAELRPRGYTAALVLVDALLTSSVDERVIARWAHVPHLRELAACALRYREATVALEPGVSNVSSIFSRVRDLLMSH